MNKLYKKIVSLFLCVFFICNPLQLIFADTLEETENTDSTITETADDTEKNVQNSDEQKNDNVDDAKYINIGGTQIKIDESILGDPQYYLYFDADGNRVDNYKNDENDDTDICTTTYSDGSQQESEMLAKASNGILGCDVSRWQGNINWKKAKSAGITFAIIRVAYRNRTTGKIDLDPYYKQNIQNALAAGIRVGAYFYSEAITTQEAVEEANTLISNVYMYNITMPLVIDYEGFNDNERIGRANLSKSQHTSIVSAFCETIKKAGYTPMIYASSSYFVNYMEGEYLSNAYRIWSAAYSNKPEHYNSVQYDFWQFTSSADGASYGMKPGGLDLDYWYNNRALYGNDYSMVFDANYYYNLYPDLQKSIGKNSAELLYHYINFGMSEGRSAIATFDVLSYKGRYPDLQKAFGNNLKSYVLHYMKFGKKEKRNGSKDSSVFTVQFIQDGKVMDTQQVQYGHAASIPTNLIRNNGTTIVFDKAFDTITKDTIVSVENRYIYKGIDYTNVFDADYYLNRYTDIKKAYGTNGDKALAHFANFGMKEGRQGSSAFSVKSYMNLYPDLRRTFGTNMKGYYMHYANYGYKEHRVATGYDDRMIGAQTKYNGKDYSSVYDFNYYISKNPDVVRVYGYDENKVLAHFVNFGMKEGRSAKESFSVKSYKNRYYDLRRAFGNNWKSYFLHYINNGIREKRVTVGYDTTLVGAQTKYNGIDYSSVYDFNYYISKNPDVLRAYGYDENKVLCHFVNFGMKEGRQANETFSLSVYKDRYIDLRRAFGKNNKAYYMHYICNGIKEGRKAV